RGVDGQVSVVAVGGGDQVVHALARRADGVRDVGHCWFPSFGESGGDGDVGRMGLGGGPAGSGGDTGGGSRGERRGDDARPQGRAEAGGNGGGAAGGTEGGEDGDGGRISAGRHAR